MLAIANDGWKISKLCHNSACFNHQHVTVESSACYDDRKRECSPWDLVRRQYDGRHECDHYPRCINRPETSPVNDGGGEQKGVEEGGKSAGKSAGKREAHFVSGT